MADSIIAAEQRYNRESSEALRSEVIFLRDEALKQGDFEWSVKLSHVIAWMAVMMDQVFGIEEGGKG